MRPRLLTAAIMLVENFCPVSRQPILNRLGVMDTQIVDNQRQDRRLSFWRVTFADLILVANTRLLIKSGSM
jgi:hypothetical protein